MPVVWIVLFMLLIAPIKAGAAFSWRTGKPVHAQLGVIVWGVRYQKDYHWRLPRIDGEQMQAMEAQVQDKMRGITSQTYRGKKKRVFWRIMHTIMISDHARGLLQQGTQLEHLRLYTTVGLADAAMCALLDAGMKSVFAILRRFPGCELHSRAAFDGQSAAQGMCIVRLRLGNLLAAALLGIAAYIVSGKKSKEEKKWNIIPLKT